MSWHPSGRARVSTRSPAALAICDRCQFTYNQRDLRWQYQWAGVQLQNIRLLVCSTCYDTPQIQLRAIVLPADPVPIFNSRPERYASIVPSYMRTMGGLIMTTVDGLGMTMAIEVTPTPNPNAPYLVPPDFP